MHGSDMTRRWPLVERTVELTEIRRGLAADDCTGVVLAGPAGVGKTTLAHAVTDTLGVDPIWVAGTESAQSIPLGVFAHLVRASASRDPVTLMAAVRESLSTADDVVLCIDDAHLLDKMSAALLLQLATDRMARIIAVLRSGETAPDAVTSLWKDAHLLRLELVPFTREQSVELVESVLGGQLEGLSADQIWRASRGNALFLRYLVEGALESGVLRQVAGVWQLRGRAAITSELAGLLDGRVGRLPESAARVLQVLALCEPIDLDVLADVVTDDAVDEAEQLRLIRVEQQGERLIVRLDHPLFGEVVRRRLGVAAARRLRGRLVRVLRERGVHSAAERLRLAELTLDSDQPADVALFDTAAADAIALANLPLAERLARAAVAQSPAIESVDVLARALLWQGRPDQVEELLSGFDPDALDPVQLVRWGCTRASNLLFAMGESVRADELLALVRRRVPGGPLALVLDGVESAFALHENRLADAVAAARRVLDADSALPWAVEWAAFGGGRALALMGRGEQVPAVLARMRAIEDRCDGLLRFPAALAQVQALTLMGRIDAAAELAARYSRYSTGGQFVAWALANTLTATVEVGAGRFGAAVTRLEQTLAAFPDERAATWSFPARVLLGATYAALGQVPQAESVLREAAAKDGRQVAVFGPQLVLARAWLAAAQGALGPAVELATAAASAAAESGQAAIEGEALHTAARFGDRTVAPRLAELAGLIDGPLIHLHAAHAAAVAATDGAALAGVAADYERHGVLLSGADAAAQAATVLDHTGDRPGTVAAAAQADRLAAACGGIATPAVRAAAHPLPISVREREVAHLVAARLSNRQIADRLTVSVRTVEGHIYRACIKLGVADREALGRLIRERGVG